jgi:hypothetical protein
MKRIKIVKKGVVTNQAELPNAEADAWLASCLAKNKFGLPARPELDANGEPTGVMLPAEYMIVEEDMTDQVEQERINRESLAYLASTDWYVVRQIDTGEYPPQDVINNRILARAAIKK